MTDTQDLIARIRDYSRGDTDALLDTAADALEAAHAEVERLTAENHELGDKAYQATHRADALQVTNDTLKHMKAAALSRLAALEKQEPIYQYLHADGGWIDQTKNSYDYNVKHGAATVRVVYAAAGASPVQPSQAVELTTSSMTAERAAYFMRRFKKEEKLLGPNEQAAVDYVIALLEQPSQAGLSDEKIIELKRGVIPLAYPAENDDLIEFARTIIAAINAKESK